MPARGAYKRTWPWSKARRKALFAAFADAEKTRGCVDCGERDLRVLQLDHVRGVKSFAISKAQHATKDIPTFLAELDKCDVRCANCHQRVTYQRRNAA